MINFLKQFVLSINAKSISSLLFFCLLVTLSNCSLLDKIGSTSATKSAASSNNNSNTGLNALDTTFGTGGYVITAAGVSENYANAVAIQNDGKIVVAGTTEPTSAMFDVVVARYTTDGTLDNAFGTGGIVITDVYSSWDDGRAVAIQPDGNILVAGKGGLNGNDIVVIRYAPSGSLDTSFGAGGIVVTDVYGSMDSAEALAIQSDGKILITGYSTNITDFSDDIVIIRYNTNGTLDTSFGVSGIVVTNINSGNDHGNDIAIQQDNKIIITGSSSGFGTSDIILARFDATGVLDSTFGTNGFVVMDLGGSENGSGVAMQPDNKILVSGWSNTVGAYDSIVLRFNSNGSADTSFNTSGLVITDASGTGADDMVEDLGIQSNGKIITAGYTFSASGANILVSRYNLDGSLDASFGTAGIVSTSIGQLNAASALAIQSDDSILVAGYIMGSGNNGFALLRYLP